MDGIKQQLRIIQGSLLELSMSNRKAGSPQTQQLEDQRCNDTSFDRNNFYNKQHFEEPSYDNSPPEQNNSSNQNWRQENYRQNNNGQKRFSSGNFRGYNKKRSDNQFYNNNNRNYGNNNNRNYGNNNNRNYGNNNNRNFNNRNYGNNNNRNYNHDRNLGNSGNRNYDRNLGNIENAENNNDMLQNCQRAQGQNRNEERPEVGVTSVTHTGNNDSPDQSVTVSDDTREEHCKANTPASNVMTLALTHNPGHSTQTCDMTLTGSLDGIQVRILIDTGSAVSILARSCFDKLAILPYSENHSIQI